MSQLMSQQADALLIVENVPQRKSDPEDALLADADLSVSCVEVRLNRDHVDRLRAQICSDSVQQLVENWSISGRKGQSVPIQLTKLRAEYQANQQQRNPKDK